MNINYFRFKIKQTLKCKKKITYALKIKTMTLEETFIWLMN